MRNGTLKIFNNLTNLQNEFRLYRRDAKGRPSHVDGFDVIRYICMSGLSLAVSKDEFLALNNSDNFYKYHTSESHSSFDSYGW